LNTGVVGILLAKKSKEFGKPKPQVDYIYIYKPRPAGWVIFLPPAPAKAIIVASVISAVSAKNFRFNCLAGFLPCQLPFLHFLTVVIFTHFRQHGQICSMSKSKHALKTTKRNVPFGWESMPFQFVILLV
jgi:hypothetical protein